MKIIYFDTETTGLNPFKDKIIEIALYIVENHKVIEKYDKFINIHEELDPEIIDLTNITNQMLEEEGFEENEVAEDLMERLEEKVLMVAHNTQFDLNFLYQLLIRHYPEGDILKLFNNMYWLDTLTIFKDRKKYPHTLQDMVKHYNLGKFQFHRAIDDAKVLPYAINAMNKERKDILKYVNIFGYNPKYKPNGVRFKFITYIPQKFNNKIVKKDKILPYKKKKGKK